MGLAGSKRRISNYDAKKVLSQIAQLRRHSGVRRFSTRASQILRRGTIKLSINSNDLPVQNMDKPFKKEGFALVSPEIDAFYGDELFYYMIDLLLLRGQFYLKAFNDEDKAMKFFRKAEKLAEDVYGCMNPNMIRMLIKIRLMLSRLYQRKGLYSQSIKILWENIDLLKMEAAVRMNEFMDCDSTESTKMVKWSKYFIITLLQMISGFLMTDEIAQAIESAKMIE